MGEIILFLLGLIGGVIIVKIFCKDIKHDFKMRIGKIFEISISVHDKKK